MKTKILLASLALITVHCTGQPNQSASQNQQKLDKQVSTFLNENRDNWRNLNVPYVDGQLLHDIVVENGYKQE